MESIDDAELIRYINLKLAALGQPASQTGIAGPLLRNYHQKNQLLGDRLCPVDARIQTFLDSYLDGCAARLPSQTLVLDMPGLARVMSLPDGEDSLASPYVHSYRISQGILHNPKSDRRTTQGIFHIVEGGLPIPADKIAVPKATFGALLSHALTPPPGSSSNCPSPRISSIRCASSPRCCCGRWYARQPGPHPRSASKSASSRPPVW